MRHSSLPGIDAPSILNRVSRVVSLGADCVPLLCQQCGQNDGGEARNTACVRETLLTEQWHHTLDVGCHGQDPAKPGAAIFGGGYGVWKHMPALRVSRTPGTEPSLILQRVPCPRPGKAGRGHVHHIPIRCVGDAPYNKDACVPWLCEPCFVAGENGRSHALLTQQWHTHPLLRTTIGSVERIGEPTKRVEDAGDVGDVDHPVCDIRLDVGSGLHWSTRQVLELVQAGRHVRRHVN